MEQLVANLSPSQPCNKVIKIVPDLLQLLEISSANTSWYRFGNNLVTTCSQICNNLRVFTWLLVRTTLLTGLKGGKPALSIISYIARVNTKRDWLICGHVTSDKCNVSRRATSSEKLEVKIPRFRFTGNIHVPVPVNRGITCNLRNARYSGVWKSIRKW
jgi:hypothetical protein